MTNPRAAPIFSVSAQPADSQPHGRFTALATLTVTGAFVYTDVRCPGRIRMARSEFPCRTWLLAIPGEVTVTVRILRNDTERNGQGLATHCPRCKSKVEMTWA